MISNSILIAILAMAGNVEAAKATVSTFVIATATTTAVISGFTGYGTGTRYAWGTATVTNAYAQTASSLATASALATASSIALASAVTDAAAQATENANNLKVNYDTDVAINTYYANAQNAGVTPITSGIWDVCGEGSPDAGGSYTTASGITIYPNNTFSVNPRGTAFCAIGLICTKVSFRRGYFYFFGANTTVGSICVPSKVVNSFNSKYYGGNAIITGGTADFSIYDIQSLVSEVSFYGQITTGAYSTCSFYSNGIKAGYVTPPTAASGFRPPAPCALGTTCKQIHASGYNVHSYLIDKQNGISPGAPGSLLLNPINQVWACVPDTVTTLRKRHSQIPTLVKRELRAVPPKEGDTRVDPDIATYNGKTIIDRYTNGAWVRQ